MEKDRLSLSVCLSLVVRSRSNTTRSIGSTSLNRITTKATDHIKQLCVVLHVQFILVCVCFKRRNGCHGASKSSSSSPPLPLGRRRRHLVCRYNLLQDGTIGYIF